MDVSWIVLLIQLIWFLVLMMGPARLILRRLVAPQLGIYGATRSHRKFKEIRFLLQNQRETPIDGPVEFELDLEESAWIEEDGMPGCEIIHGPAGKVERCNDRTSPLILVARSGLRPLETFEVICRVRKDLSDAILKVRSEGGTSGVGIEGSLELDVESGESGLGKPRMTSIGFNRGLFSVGLVVILGVVVFFSTWIGLVVFAADSPLSMQTLVDTWQKTIVNESQYRVALGIFGIAIYSICAYWMWRRRETPLIQGYRGNSLSSTKFWLRARVS